MTSTLASPAQRFTPSLAAARAAAPLTSTTSVTIDATPEATLAALRLVDLAGPVLRAITALSADGRIALHPAAVPSLGGAALSLAMIFRVEGSAPRGFVTPAGFAAYSVPGHVKARWDFAVRPGVEDQAFLSIRTRFEATDHRSRVRLRDAWALIGPLSSSLAARAAAAVKATAEEDEPADG